MAAAVAGIATTDFAEMFASAASASADAASYCL